MKLKQCLLPALAVSTLLLSSCGGDGNAGPQSSANYGQVNAIVQQNLQSSKQIPIFAPAPAPVPYNITMRVGFYVESDYTSQIAFESANQANTKNDFKFDVKAIQANAKASTVSAYSVLYNTPGQNAGTDPDQIVRNASGLVIIPNGTPIRGVVMYFHPTTFGKNQVPSCLTPSTTKPNYCNIPTSDDNGYGTFSALATIFASRGFAVIAPDYVGQGNDYNNVHPYAAYPEVNALSGLYMLPALRKLLAENGTSMDTNLPLLLTGYSEGGGYSLRASQLAQTSYANYLAQNNVTLKMTSPQEGAYSLNDQMNFAFANLNDGVFNCANNPDPAFVCGESDAIVYYGTNQDEFNISPAVLQMNNWKIGSAIYAAAAKPALTSYVLASAMYYTFHNLTTAYNFAMNTQFWDTIPMPSGDIDTLYQLYSGSGGSKYTGSQISASIVANTMNINNYNPRASYLLNLFIQSQPAVGVTMPKSAIGYGQNNAGSLFINQGITSNPDFQSIIASGSTDNWHTNSPVNFIHMNYDSAVTMINSRQAYSCMKNGTTYSGDANTVASSGACSSSSASPNMVESTIINNFQLTNELTQLFPLDDLQESPNPTAYSHYWTSITSLVSPEQAGDAAMFLPLLGVPFDHGDMFVLGNIVALCTFENQLANGTNSGECPTLN